MNNILSWFSFCNEELYFEGNFTPLYHITGSIIQIITDDKLKVGRPSRGPKGICVTRSKYFSHERNTHGTSPRIILNREKLLQDGYKSYPLDEWGLKHGINKEGAGKIGGFLAKDNPRPWANPDIIKKHHMGKSQFPKLQVGKRPISHNIKGLPGKEKGLEVEYEERILKDIEDVGKYIYAFNFKDAQEYERYKPVIDKYKQKYPKIKILLGLTHFTEI